MSIYKHLEIRQTHPCGTIGILLDGEPVKGCTDLTLSLGVDEMPRLTMTVMVQAVDVSMGADMDVRQFSAEPPGKE